MDRKVESQYDKIAKAYQKNLTDLRYYSNLVNKFCSKVRGKILDAGCGSGLITNLIFLKNSLVSGIDISQGMIKEAQKQYPKIKFQKMNMQSLKFKDKSFNGIFCFQAFEHISPDNQEKVLGEFFKVLQDGGILMFNTNNRFYPRRFFIAILNKFKFPRAKFGEIEIDGKTQTYRYLSTFRELNKKVRDAGFKIISYEAPRFGKWLQIWAVKEPARTI